MTDDLWDDDEDHQQWREATIHGLTVTARTQIDLNVRVEGNRTYVGIEDIEGEIAEGDEIGVYQEEIAPRLLGTGRVYRIDRAKGLVFLEVDWASLR